MSVSELLRTGFEHLEHDRIARARTAFEEALSSQPESAEVILALRGLAEAAEMSGDPPEARQHLERAAREAPEDADVQLELGLVLARSDEPGLAIDHLQRAVELNPESAETLNNLGAVQFDANRFEDAAASYRRAIDLTPETPIPSLNLSEALEAAGDTEGAIAAARTAATLDPDLPLAWSMLGATLVRAGRPLEALGPLRRAGQLEPENGATQRLFAEQLYQLDQDLDEAARAFERALAVEEAVDLLRGLGHVELQRERYLRAERLLTRALELEPDHCYARFHQAQARFELGATDAAIETLKDLSRSGAPELRAASALNLAVTIPGAPRADGRAILEARTTFARTLPRIVGGGPPARSSGAPITVGYVSSFFHRRNWMKPVWGLLNEHDRERVRVHLFSDAPFEALEGGYAPHATDSFTDISRMSNAEAADAIRAADIDVLVDLNGYSEPNRLEIYTRRPAPILVGWFNLYATSGLDAFDVLIGDDSVVRPDEESDYTERIVRVPGSYLTFSVDYPVPEVARPPCTTGTGFTLGCLASGYKITDEVVDTWVSMLGQAPEARLLCRNKLLGDEEQREWFAARFTSRGLARDRIELHGPCDHDAFLTTYARIDLALDVFPYNGGTTTTEALWQGVPVATFDGDRWASRTSASILNAAGLEEFVAPDRESHIARVAEIANDPDAPKRLRKLRESMRERLQRSPVCDTGGFARALESHFEAFQSEALERESDR